jgi:hypothetical protein
MKRRLPIEIDCGDQTCAKEPGKFCRFFGQVKFGTIPVCMLFPSVDNSHTILEQGPDGWTLRCTECLAKQTQVRD